jgi:hypothetical protein
MLTSLRDTHARTHVAQNRINRIDSFLPGQHRLGPLDIFTDTRILTERCRAKPDNIFYVKLLAYYYYYYYYFLALNRIKIAIAPIIPPRTKSTWIGNPPDDVCAPSGASAVTTAYHAPPDS